MTDEAEREEQKRVKKPIRRGWVLFYSCLLEMVATIITIAFFGLPLAIPFVVIVFLVIGFLLIYFWWAPRNLFFTFVPEGRAKMVVRGDAFEKALIQWSGRSLAAVSVPEQKIDVGDVIETPDKKAFFGGLKFYGWWPVSDILIYPFSWTNRLPDGEIKEHKREIIDHILLKPDVYWARVSEAEDKNLLPVDVEMVLTIRIVNPYKALFRIQNWLETVINRTAPAVRDRLTEKEFDKWITEPADLGKEIFSDLVQNGLLNEFGKEYGVEVQKIEVTSINPPANYREATLKRFVAERERDAVLVGADAEQKRIAAVYGAIQAFGDLGKLARFLEALEKAKEGTRWIIPSGLLPDLTGQVLTAEEVAQLKGAIKQRPGQKGEPGNSKQE